MNTKLQPQAPEMEQAVLGAVLLEQQAIHTVEPILQPDDFYIPANREIFRAVMNLCYNKNPVDMLTVTEELKRTGKLDECGGILYISQLTNIVAGSSHVEYHALIVKQKAHARSLIHLASKLMEKAYHPATDIYQAQEEFEQEFTALNISKSNTTAWDMPQVLKETIAQVTQRTEKQQKGEIVAIPTGLPQLDDILDGGTRPGELNVISARPGVGKTQFALFCAKTAATHGKKGVFVSMEMGYVQLGGRFLLQDDRINPSRFRKGTMQPAEWEAMEETAGKLWNLPIHIAADHNIRYLKNIKSLLRRMKRTEGLDMAVLDYLGLIKTHRTYDKRYLEIGEITSEIKSLAKELDISILLLAQLARPAKGYIHKKPTFDDLRESGNIEQDADNILILHKPTYNDPDGQSWKNRVQIIIPKQREGISDITLEYNHDNRYKNLW